MQRLSDSRLPLTLFTLALLTIPFSTDCLDGRHPDSPLDYGWAQEPVRSGRSGGEIALSPGVWATWFGETRNSSLSKLLLVVLWRGSAGWHTGKPVRDTAIIGKAQSELQLGPPGKAVRDSLFAEYRVGEIGFGIWFYPSTRTARVLGRQLSVDDHNLILVDRVDGVSGTPEVVGTARIDPHVPHLPLNLEGARKLAELLREKEEIRTFLR